MLCHFFLRITARQHGEDPLSFVNYIFFEMKRNEGTYGAKKTNFVYVVCMVSSPHFYITMETKRVSEKEVNVGSPDLVGDSYVAREGSIHFSPHFLMSTRFGIDLQKLGEMRLRPPIM